MRLRVAGSCQGKARRVTLLHVCAANSAITLTGSQHASRVRDAGGRPAWSPMNAQCWYEWRQTGLILPLVVGSICLVMSAPLLWIDECTPLFDHPVNGWLADIEINLYFKTYLMQPWLLPPFAAAIAGYSFWIPQAKSQDRSLPLYLATRPLRDLDIVMTRARVAVGSALGTRAVLLVFVVVWMMSPAKDGDINAPLLSIVARHLTWQPLPKYALALVWLVAWTWRNQAIALFSGFADRAADSPRRSCRRTRQPVCCLCCGTPDGCWFLCVRRRQM